jgi:hypothetical protein
MFIIGEIKLFFYILINCAEESIKQRKIITPREYEKIRGKLIK